MLHVAQYAPSIRHAVFALSSMHEYYASVHESREVLHDFSMHHYNKAIRQIIRISEPEQSFDTLLLTAVMFVSTSPPWHRPAILQPLTARVK